MTNYEKTVAQLTQKLQLAETKKRFREQIGRDESNVVGVVSAIEFDELKAEMENLKGIIARQEEESTLKSQTIQQLTSDLSSAKYDLQSFERSKHKLEQKVDELLKKETHFSERLESMREECSKSMQRKEESLQEEMQDLRRKAQEHNAYLSSKAKIEAHISRLESEDKKKSEQLEVYSQRVANAEKAVRERDDQMKASSKDMFLLSSQLMEKDRAIYALQASLSTVSEVIEVVNANIEGLTDAASTALGNYASRLTSAEAAIAQAHIESKLTPVSSVKTNEIVMEQQRWQKMYATLREEYQEKEREWQAESFDREACISSLRQQLLHSGDGEPHKEVMPAARKEEQTPSQHEAALSYDDKRTAFDEALHNTNTVGIAVETQTEALVSSSACSSSQTDEVEMFALEPKAEEKEYIDSGVDAAHFDDAQPHVPFDAISAKLESIPVAISTALARNVCDTDGLIHIVEEKLALEMKSVNLNDGEAQFLRDAVMWTFSSTVPLVITSGVSAMGSDSVKSSIVTEKKRADKAIEIREIGVDDYRESSEVTVDDTQASTTVCNASCQTDEIIQKPKQRRSLTEKSADAHRRDSGMSSKVRTAQPSRSSKEPRSSSMKTKKSRKSSKVNVKDPSSAPAVAGEEEVPAVIVAVAEEEHSAEIEAVVVSAAPSSDDESSASSNDESIVTEIATDRCGDVKKDEKEELSKIGEHELVRHSSDDKQSSGDEVRASQNSDILSVNSALETQCRDLQLEVTRLTSELQRNQSELHMIQEELAGMKRMEQNHEKEKKVLKARSQSTGKERQVITKKQSSIVSELGEDDANLEESKPQLVDSSGDLNPSSSESDDDESFDSFLAPSEASPSKASPSEAPSTGPVGFDASKYLAAAAAATKDVKQDIPPSSTSARRASRVKAMELFQKTQPTKITDEAHSSSNRSPLRSREGTAPRDEQSLASSPTGLHDVSILTERSDTTRRNSNSIPFSELAFARAHMRDKLNQRADLGSVKAEQFDALRGGIFGTDDIVELTRLMFYSRSMNEDESSSPVSARQSQKTIKPIGSTLMQRRSPALPSRKATSMALNLEVSALSQKIASSHSIDELAKYLCATEKKLLMIRSMSIWKSIKHSIDNDMFQDILIVHRDNLQKCIQAAGGWQTAFEFAKNESNYITADTSFWPDFFRVKALEHYRSCIGEKLIHCESDIKAAHEVNTRLRSELEEERKGMAEERAWAFKEISVLSKQIASLLLTKSEAGKRPSSKLDNLKTATTTEESAGGFILRTDPSTDLSVQRLNSSNNPYYIQSTTLKNNIAVQNVMQNVETEKRLLSRPISGDTVESPDMRLRSQQRRVDDLAFAVYRKKADALSLAQQLLQALTSWRGGYLNKAKHEFNLCGALCSAESEAAMIDCFSELLQVNLSSDANDALSNFIQTLDESLQMIHSDNTTSAVSTKIVSPLPALSSSSAAVARDPSVASSGVLREVFPQDTNVAGDQPLMTHSQDKRPSLPSSPSSRITTTADPTNARNVAKSDDPTLGVASCSDSNASSRASYIVSDEHPSLNEQVAHAKFRQEIATLHSSHSSAVAGEIREIADQTTERRTPSPNIFDTEELVPAADGDEVAYTENASPSVPPLESVPISSHISPADTSSARKVSPYQKTTAPIVPAAATGSARRRAFKRLTSNDDLLEEAGIGITKSEHPLHEKTIPEEAAEDVKPSSAGVVNNYNRCSQCGCLLAAGNSRSVPPLEDDSSQTICSRKTVPVVTATSGVDNSKDVKTSLTHISPAAKHNAIGNAMPVSSPVSEQLSAAVAPLTSPAESDDVISDILHPLREQISAPGAPISNTSRFLSQQPASSQQRSKSLLRRVESTPIGFDDAGGTSFLTQQPYHHMAKQFSQRLVTKDVDDKCCQTDDSDDVTVSSHPLLLRQPSIVTSSTKIASPSASQKSPATRSVHEVRILLARHLNTSQLQHAAVTDCDSSEADIEICSGVVLLSDFENLLWTGKRAKSVDDDDLEDEEDEEAVDKEERYRDVAEMRRRRFLPPGVTLARRVRDEELPKHIVEWHGWSDMPFPKPHLPRDVVAVQLPATLTITPNVELISHLQLGTAFELPADVWAVRVKCTRQIVDDEDVLEELENSFFDNLLPPALRPVEIAELLRISKSLSLKLAPLVKLVEMSQLTTFIDVPSWCSAVLPDGFEFAKGVIHKPKCYLPSLNSKPQEFPFSLPSRIFPVKIAPHAILPTFLRPLLVEGELDVTERADDEELYKENTAAGVTIVPTPTSIELPAGMVLIRRNYSRVAGIPCRLPPGMRIVPPSAHPPRLKLSPGIELVQLTPRFELPAGVKLNSTTETIHRPVGLRLPSDSVLVARSPGSVLPRGAVLATLPENTNKNIYLPSGVDLLSYPAGLVIPFGTLLSPGISVVNVPGVADKLPVGVCLVKRDPGVEMAVPGFERGFKSDLPSGSRLPPGVEVLRLRPRYEVPAGVLLAHNTVLGKDIQLPVGVEIIPGVEVVEWQQGMFLPPKMELVKLKENSFLPKYLHVVGAAELSNLSTKTIDNRCPIGCIVIYLPDNLHLPSAAQLTNNIEVCSFDNAALLPSGVLPIKRADANLPLPAELSYTSTSSIAKSAVPIGVELVRVVPRYLLPPGIEICDGVKVAEEPLANMLPDDLTIAAIERNEEDEEWRDGIEPYDSIDLKQLPQRLEENQRVVYITIDSIRKVKNWGQDFFYLRPVMLSDSILVPPYCFFVEELDAQTPLSHYFEVIPREEVASIVPASESGVFNLPVNVSLIRLKPSYCLPVGMSITNDLRMTYGCRFSASEPLGNGFEVALESISYDSTCLVACSDGAASKLPPNCIAAPASQKVAGALTSSLRVLLCESSLSCYKERVLSNIHYMIDVEKRLKESENAAKFSGQKEKITLLISDAGTSASMNNSSIKAEGEGSSKVSLVAYKALQAKNEKLLSEVSQLETQCRYLQRSNEAQSKELSYALAKQEKASRLCNDAQAKYRDAQAELLQVRASVKKGEATLQLRIDDLGFQVRSLEFSISEKDDKIESLSAKLKLLEKNGVTSAADLEKHHEALAAEKVAACQQVLREYRQVLIAVISAACELAEVSKNMTIDKLRELPNACEEEKNAPIDRSIIDDSTLDDVTIESKAERRLSNSSLMSASLSQLPKLTAKQKQRPSQHQLLQQKHYSSSGKLPSIKLNTAPAYILATVDYKKQYQIGSIDNSMLADVSVLTCSEKANIFPSAQAMTCPTLLTAAEYLQLVDATITINWEANDIVTVDKNALQTTISTWQQRASSVISFVLARLVRLYDRSIVLVEREVEVTHCQLSDTKHALKYAEDRIEELKTLSSSAATASVRLAELERSLRSVHRQQHSMRQLAATSLIETLKSKARQIFDLSEQYQRLQLVSLLLRQKMTEQRLDDIHMPDKERRAIKQYVKWLRKRDEKVKQRMALLQVERETEISVLRNEVEAIEGIVQDIIPPKLLSKVLETSAAHSLRSHQKKNLISK